MSHQELSILLGSLGIEHIGHTSPPCIGREPDFGNDMRISERYEGYDTIQ